jgi:Arc/MetJ-type ribon-helix-helix transcriptional regulator
MTIDLPTDIAGQLASHVTSGDASAEDALLAAVKLLGEEKDRQRKFEELKRSLREADEQIDRGECFDVDEAFDQVEMKLFGRKLPNE